MSDESSCSCSDISHENSENDVVITGKDCCDYGVLSINNKSVFNKQLVNNFNADFAVINKISPEVSNIVSSLSSNENIPARNIILESSALLI
jgi:hypothetical protein